MTEGRPAHDESARRCHVVSLACPRLVSWCHCRPRYTPHWYCLPLEEYLSSKLPDLTTTSYAILGLLTIKPWSTYELAKQMQRDRFVWPRAESNLYAEPKKLIAHGFASAHSEPRGKRRRTVYSITPGGQAGPRRLARETRSRAALGSGINGQVHLRDRRLEGTATRELRDFRRHATVRWEAVEAIFRPISRATSHSPTERNLNVLPEDLLETARLQAEWADRTIEEVQKWHTTAETPGSRGNARRAESRDRRRSALNPTWPPGAKAGATWTRTAPPARGGTPRRRAGRTASPPPPRAGPARHRAGSARR